MELTLIEGAISLGWAISELRGVAFFGFVVWVEVGILACLAGGMGVMMGAIAGLKGALKRAMSKVGLVIAFPYFATSNLYTKKSMLMRAR